MTITKTLAQIKTAVAMTTGASSDFDLNPEVIPPVGRNLHPCGVLVPLLLTPTGIDVILTKRSSALKHHPGQIAFPGGKVDAKDGGPVAAALREAQEEIGLLAQNVEIIGELAVHETVTGFLITPVIGLVRDAFDPRPEPGEVDEVFSVPLSYVTDPSRFQIQYRMWRKVRRYYYVVPYGPYYIWGATARILHGLAEGMAK